MSYVINKTNGDILTTLLDGTTNTETGLTLIGRNYTGYGEVQNENFIRLLENFSSTVPPSEGGNAVAPLAGMLWWDSGNQRLKIFNGDSYISVSPIVDSATAPTANTEGDLWWNIVTHQMSVWNGTEWLLVGPAYTTAQGKSGQFVETLLDNTDVSHTVVVNYVNNAVVSINSSNTFIVSPPTYGFSYITSGINLPGNKVIEGNASIGGITVLNSDTTINGKLYLAPSTGAGAAVLPVTTEISDIGSTSNKFRDLHLSGKLVLTDANISFSNKTLTVENKNLSGNVDVYVNSPTLGSTRATQIDGSTGLLYVAGDPIDPMGVATKGYTDTLIESTNTTLTAAIDSTNSNVAVLRSDLDNNISSILNTLTADINILTSVDIVTAARLDSIETRQTADEISVDTNFNQVNADIADINAQLPTYAPIDSPALVGAPTAPTADSADNSGVIATTAFVKTATAATAVDYNYKITNLTNATAANLANGLALKANIASPAFTGTPTAPTPTVGDNSTRLATTAFVTGAVATQKFNYTVSANPPSGGNNGDFWFQVG